MNEVLNGIDPGKCTLGILPVGTMNVLALELGISPDIEKSLQIIRAGKRRRFDLATPISAAFCSLPAWGWMPRWFVKPIRKPNGRGAHGVIF